MNDPDDLYYCTYGELVEGQKYRFYTDAAWGTVGVGLAWNASHVVQAQRWVEPPPPPVTVEIEADTLEAALTTWSRQTAGHGRKSRAPLWDAIHDARKKAES